MNFFKKIFGRNKEKSVLNETTANLLYTQSLDLREMLNHEIKNSIYIKKECKPTLIQTFDLLNNPNFGDEFLTTDEKKFLKLNSRVKIPKKVIEVLTEDGLLIESSPKDVILNIFRSANNKVNLNIELNKKKKVGIKQFKVANSGDERDCEWCNSVNQKIFPIDTDYVALINENCSCKYHRGLINSVINIDDN